MPNEVPHLPEPVFPFFGERPYCQPKETVLKFHAEAVIFIVVHFDADLDPKKEQYQQDCQNDEYPDDAHDPKEYF